MRFGGTTADSTNLIFKHVKVIVHYNCYCIPSVCLFLGMHNCEIVLRTREVLLTQSWQLSHSATAAEFISDQTLTSCQQDHLKGQHHLHYLTIRQQPPLNMNQNSTLKYKT